MSKRLGGIVGCKVQTSWRHLNGFPDGSNIGYCCALTLIAILLAEDKKKSIREVEENGNSSGTVQLC